MKRTLIVVDMQKDFVYGPLGTEEARAIVPNIEKKIEKYHERGDKIIFTRDIHTSDYLNTHEGRYLPVQHCLESTDGISFVIPRTRNTKVYRKSNFGYTGWYSALMDAYPDEVEIVGVCTDICVISNALMLRSIFPEFDITVDASCCAGTTPEKHKAALEVMKSCHIDILNE